MTSSTISPTCNSFCCKPKLGSRWADMEDSDGDTQDIMANGDNDGMDTDLNHGDDKQAVNDPEPQPQKDHGTDGPHAPADSDDEPLVPPPPAPVGERGGRERMPRGTRPAPMRVQPIKKPMEPGRLERERHEMCHLPFADWCKHCVKARSLSSQHRTKKHHSAKEVPVVSGDFCFLSREEQD